MSAAPSLSVIIPVFNKWDLTAACLDSLARHRPGVPFEVLVVDNGSTDETVFALPELGPSLFGKGFTRIRFEENRNFGPGCNAGARAASAPLLFFLNNDTLLTPDWYPPLARALEADPCLGAAGPLLLYANDTVQHLGVSFSVRSVNHLYRGFPREHPVVARRRFFQALTAAALLLPAAVFQEAGMFHEEYCNGFEDVDLCLHIRKLGKRLTCVPESVIYHLESQSPGRNEADKTNGEILTRRCRALYTPDEHVFGRLDGFAPFVNDALDVSLGLGPEQDRDLRRRAEGRPVEACLRLAREHPYWAAGREGLARVLEEAGETGLALFLLSEAARARLSVEAYRDLALAAARAGDARMREEADALHRKLLATRSDKAYFRSMLRQVRAHGDAFLESLFERKRRACFP